MVATPKVFGGGKSKPVLEIRYEFLRTLHRAGPVSLRSHSSRLLATKVSQFFPSARHSQAPPFCPHAALPFTQPTARPLRLIFLACIMIADSSLLDRTRLSLSSKVTLTMPSLSLLPESWF